MLTFPELGGDTEAAGENRLESVDAVSTQLLRLVKLIHRIKVHDHDENGMETSAYRVLAEVVGNGPARTTALADALHSDASTISRQTNALVRAGLLMRTPDPADGRACVLAPTDEGARMFEHARQSRDAHMAQMLRDWDDDELRQLVELLDRFNTDFEIYRPNLTGHGRKIVGAGEHDDRAGHEGEKE